MDFRVLYVMDRTLLEVFIPRHNSPSLLPSVLYHSQDYILPPLLAVVAETCLPFLLRLEINHLPLRRVPALTLLVRSSLPQTLYPADVHRHYLIRHLSTPINPCRLRRTPTYSLPGVKHLVNCARPLHCTTRNFRAATSIANKPIISARPPVPVGLATSRNFLLERPRVTATHLRFNQSYRRRHCLPSPKALPHSGILEGHPRHRLRSRRFIALGRTVAVVRGRRRHRPRRHRWMTSIGKSSSFRSLMAASHRRSPCRIVSAVLRFL